MVDERVARLKQFVSSILNTLAERICMPKSNKQAREAQGIGPQIVAGRHLASSWVFGAVVRGESFVTL